MSLLVVNKQFTSDMLGIRSRTNEFISKYLQDLNPIWDGVASEIKTGMRENFEKESGGLTRWKRLTPNYRAWKEEHYPGRKILELTGKLKMAATGEGADFFIQKQKSSMIYGIRNIPYAEIHARGGTIPRRFVAPKRKKALRWIDKGKERFSKGHWIGPTKIPKRDYLALSKERHDRINAQVGGTLMTLFESGVVGGRGWRK